MPQEREPGLPLLGHISHLLKRLPQRFRSDAVSPCWQFGKEPGTLGDRCENRRPSVVSNQDFDIAEVIAFFERETELQVILLR